MTRSNLCPSSAPSLVIALQTKSIRVTFTALSLACHALVTIKHYKINAVQLLFAVLANLPVSIRKGGCDRIFVERGVRTPC